MPTRHKGMKAQRDDGRLMDVNGNPANSNDCDPDTAAQGELGQDRRYFYHQDRNWNVVALTEYDDGAGTNGRLAERYAYTPYGELVVTQGDSGSGELGRALVASTVGNVSLHQGLPFDQEKASYQNRRREYVSSLARVGLLDLIGYDAKEGHPYRCGGTNLLTHTDPRVEPDRRRSRRTAGCSGSCVFSNGKCWSLDCQGEGGTLCFCAGDNLSCSCRECVLIGSGVCTCKKKVYTKRCSYYCEGLQIDIHISCGPGNWDPPCPGDSSARF